MNWIVPVAQRLFYGLPMPRAGDFPRIEIEGNGVPTQRNPLGVKGAGEAELLVRCLQR